MAFVPLRLVSMLVADGLSKVAVNSEGKRVAVPQPSPRNTKTSLNMEQQREVWQAAQDKRARRQARNLRNAGITQESTL